ncbi:MAG: c-type cytochrome [Thiotrichales bacterium]
MIRPIVVLLLSSLTLVACSGDKEPQDPRAIKGDGAAGKLVAERKCLSCHGLDGVSVAVDTPHIAGQHEAYLRVAMQEYKDGTRGHPSLQQMVSDVSDREMIDAAAYYASLPAPTADPAVTSKVSFDENPVEQGRAAAEMCGGCHGEDGNSPLPGTPSLAGQQQDYLIAALAAYKDGHRKDDVMPAFVAEMDAATMSSIALFYASQAPVARDKAETGDVAAGEALAAGCAGCHGEGGNSTNSKNPTLAGQDAAFLSVAMKAYRDGGRENDLMKGAVAALTDQEIEHIAAYYTAQAPKQATVKRPLVAAEWLERCERCHAPGVEQAGLIVPRLDAQRYDYLVKSLKGYHDGVRKHSTMHAMGAPLTDELIDALASHYASLNPR